MTFPGVQLPVTVEALIDGVWEPVPWREPEGIRISRGRKDESSKTQPTKCRMRIDNADGRWNPRNPLSPFFGNLTRNTQLRVIVDGQTRHHGEVSAWSPRWEDASLADRYVPIESSGILRRLAQWRDALQSTLYRALTSLDANQPVAYWPCEDGRRATQLSSAIENGDPLTPGGSGETQLAAYSGFAASQPIPTLGGQGWGADVTPYTPTGAIQFRFLLSTPSDGIPADANLISFSTTGSAQTWLLRLFASGSMEIRAFDPFGNNILASTIGFDLNGRDVRFSLELEEIAGNVEYNLSSMDATTGTVGGAEGALINHTVGRASRVAISPQMTEVSVGHITVQPEIDSLFSLFDQTRAFVGESAISRITRLCDEEGVFVSITGAGGASMGPQLPKRFLELIEECVDADRGILRDGRDFLGLEYIARTALYDRAPVAAVDVSNRELFPELQPEEDDQLTVNDVTASRENGGTARFTVTEGALSVPVVGRYPSDPELNVESDVQLPGIAEWIAHLGTVDEPRYPEITLDRAALILGGNPTLAAAAMNLDQGDRLDLANSQMFDIYDDVRQMVQGYSESIGPYLHRMTFNCSPYSPFLTFVLDDTGSRLDSETSTLNSTLSPGATVFTVHIGHAFDLWTTDVADFPFDVKVNAERMTVTSIGPFVDIGGGAFTQDFTAIRAVNGLDLSHASGSEVHLADPKVWAL